MGAAAVTSSGGRMLADAVLADEVNRTGAAAQRRLVSARADRAGCAQSLEPMVARRGSDADHDELAAACCGQPHGTGRLEAKRSPTAWPARLTSRSWVLDDTGFPKDGTRRRAVRRQYSGARARSATARSGCRCTRSAPGEPSRGNGAVSARGVVRRSRATPPGKASRRRSTCHTEPELGAHLIERAGSWDIPQCCRSLATAPTATITAAARAPRYRRYSRTCACDLRQTTVSPSASETNVIVDPRARDRARATTKPRAPGAADRDRSQAVVAELGDKRRRGCDRLRDGPDGHHGDLAI